MKKRRFCIPWILILSLVLPLVVGAPHSSATAQAFLATGALLAEDALKAWPLEFTLLENAKPVAVADTYTVAAGTALTVSAEEGVLANDYDPDGDPLTARLMGGAAFGDLIFHTDGSFTYTPSSGFSGADHFSYKADDGTDLSLKAAVVTINVTAEGSHAPVAVADSYAVEVNGTLIVTAEEGVLANDVDADGDPLTAELLGGAAFGNLSLQPNGAFTYTPNAGYVGTDHFAYQASDGVYVSKAAMVTINVTAEGQSAPVAVADFYTVQTNGMLNVPAVEGVLINDSDADGDPLTAQLLGVTAFGTLTLNPDGSFIYVPRAGYVGTDRFTYQAFDGLYASSAALVTINVVAEGHTAPVAEPDAYEVAAGAVLTVVAADGVLANDFDADGDVLTAELLISVRQGTLVFEDDGSFVYTPNAGFAGVDRFVYRASDGTYTSRPTTVTINVLGPADHPPVALPDSYSTEQGTTLVVSAATGVLANDTDADGDTLTAYLLQDVTEGVLTLNADGSFIYVPHASFVGEDTFWYEAVDGLYASQPAVVTITVTLPGNTCPVAVADAYTVRQDTTLTVGALQGVLANDGDADGDTLTAQLVTDVTTGTLTLNADGSFTYVPGASYLGTDSFTYVAHDGSCASAPVVVTLTVIPPGNTCPVAVSDVYTAVQNSTLTVGVLQGVLANDSDAEGDLLSAVLVRDVSSGTLALVINGSFIYVPAPDFLGEDSFEYKASDGVCDSAPVEVMITVVRANAVPVAVADVYTVRQGNILVVGADEGVLANDSDVDGDALMAHLLVDVTKGVLSLDADGSFTYSPDVGFVGEDIFVYRASDGSALSAPAAVRLWVQAAIFLPLVLR